MNSIEELVAQLQDKLSGISHELATRWVYAYGTRLWLFLNQATSVHELGQDFGHGLYAQEVDYLVEHEWAVSTDDILKRRTKLYLEFSENDVFTLDNYLIEVHERRLQRDVA